MSKETLYESINPEKAIEKEIKTLMKKWHHDIQYIDGEFVEDVALRYQKTKDEEDLYKITKNYEIFKGRWAVLYSKYFEGDIEAGMLIHDEAIWKAALKFDMKKAIQKKGKAFNAYLISALMNGLKNHFHASRSKKNRPTIMCPICGEDVHEIDNKHLKHLVTIDNYQKIYPNHPLVWYSDILDKKRAENTGHYIKCPITNIYLYNVPKNYPEGILEGYSKDQFSKDFNSFKFEKGKQKDIPLINNDILILDENEYLSEHRPAIRQVEVFNPYLNKYVAEISIQDLQEAGTNLKKHLTLYSTLWLERKYPFLATCPYTGKNMKRIKKEHLLKLNKTQINFYMDTCKYPLKKWQVKCAICGDWVDNIWSHLTLKEHHYADSLTREDFDMRYGNGPIKKNISSNVYIQNDSGDTIHLADLFGIKNEPVDFLEIQDSLKSIAKTELENKIANSIQDCHSLEDIFHGASDKKEVKLSMSFKSGQMREFRKTLNQEVALEDFDICIAPEDGESTVTLMIPSRDTIRKTFRKMIESSDLLKY